METINIFETKEKNHKQGIKESFPVTGMTCASCAASVESVLKHTDGVFDASVNFASSSVLVEYDKELSPNQLQKALSRHKKSHYLVSHFNAAHFYSGNVLYGLGTRKMDIVGVDRSSFILVRS
mgnify:CR=1 FL=1